jgi:DNA modification methylase
MELDLRVGDSLEVLKELEDNSVDSVATDPPYGLAFMGKKWDYDVPSVELWEQVFRVLKPGGYLLSFGGSRTYHRMVVNIEDAGFEIRDQIMWIYGSGFPKSHNIGKSVDKLLGNEREVVGSKKGQGNIPNDRGNWGLKPNTDVILDKGNTEWEGWGTALKPAHEPIVMARKPLSEKTVAKNVLEYGTGGINIDGCRIKYDENNKPIPQLEKGKTKVNSNKKMFDGQSTHNSRTEAVIGGSLDGRFPANVIHDGSDEVTECFPKTKSGAMKREVGGYGGDSIFFNGKSVPSNQYGDSGNASRFFYCAKAGRRDRDDGLGGEYKLCGMMEDDNYAIKTGSGNLRETKRKNTHPTVKPTSLMQYLIRLVTPPNGTVLDPFNGSGSTGKACAYETIGKYIGIDLDEEYINISKARIEFAIGDSGNDITTDGGVVVNTKKTSTSSARTKKFFKF